MGSPLTCVRVCASCLPRSQPGAREAAGGGDPSGEPGLRCADGLCPPELKVRTPAHTKQLGWYVEFESRVTQGFSTPSSAG